MSNIAKVFEKGINDQLKLLLTPRLSKNQHGFLQNRSIESNWMEFSTHIHDAFEHGAQVDCFYADIQKAFDQVDQSQLIRNSPSATAPLIGSSPTSTIGNNVSDSDPSNQI